MLDSQTLLLQHAATMHTSNVKNLGCGWKSHIPKTPDFPVGYFDEEEPGNGSDGELSSGSGGSSGSSGSDD